MKNTARLAKFLLQFTIAGLALAFLVVWWRPQWVIGGSGPVVRVTSEPASVPPDTMDDARMTFSPAVRQAGPAVVNIHAAKIVEERRNPYFNDPLMERFFGDSAGPPRRILERTLGSGVTVTSDGYILTNNHVIEGAEQIQVALHDGRTLPASIVGRDPDTDLAVLKVEPEETRDLPAITLGSGEKLSVGDIVLAIGNPYGIGQTVTMGIVSATGRSDLQVATYENFIQTDAAINIGNSGGALINSRGELVGVNTAILNRDTGAQGISFAIPVELAADVFREIVEHGHVVRGWLGVSSAELATGPGVPAVLPTRGVQVAAVNRGGPADRAGIQPGDVILAANGREVNDVRTLQNWVAGVEPGTEVTLQVDHDGEIRDAAVVVAERPAPGN